MKTKENKEEMLRILTFAAGQVIHAAFAIEKDQILAQNIDFHHFKWEVNLIIICGFPLSFLYEKPLNFICVSSQGNVNNFSSLGNFYACVEAVFLLVTSY